MFDEAGYSGLIDAIYNAAFEPDSWPAALARVVDAVGANSACFCTANLADKRIEMLPIGIGPRAAQDYTHHYARIDPFMPALLASAPGRAYSDLMFMPRHEMERTETYRDWAVPNGIRSAAAVALQHDSARIVTLAVMRERRDDEFAPHTLRRLESLANHLRRALGVQRRLGAAGSRAAALDRLSDGVLLVDRAAHVLYANRAAEDTLADASALRTERGVLAGRRPRDTAALHALIAGGGGAMRLWRSGRAALNIVVAPRPASQSPLEGEQPAAFIFVGDPERQMAPSAQRLRTLFGLTPMQAAIAREIAGGDGIDAAAARLGVSRATARAHLSAVFTKTKTARQAELVRVLLRCVPDLRDE